MYSGCRGRPVYMKRSWFPIFLVAGLIGLLALLGVLQYQWLSKISENDKERMQKRLEVDTQRFAADFNKEVQSAYFNFQLDADSWRAKNWAEFAERYDYWKQKAAYPTLIKEIYFTENRPDAALLRYSIDNKTFDTAEWTPQLNDLRGRFSNEKTFRPVYEDVPALVMPVQELGARIDHLILKRTSAPVSPENQVEPPKRIVEPPQKYGFLVILLDEATIKEQILPALTKSYFPDGDYDLAVTWKNSGDTVFKTREALQAGDASTGIFELAPDFVFFANKDALPLETGENKRDVVISSKVESHTFTATTKPPEAGTAEKSSIKIELDGANKPRTTVFERHATISDRNSTDNGAWLLQVRHANGSLEEFIASNFRRNLLVSFGVLALVAVSILLIFFSTQRVKRFAQRQVDFVSSVSHEFRTPLAVIYSAGENLADGVAKEEEQVSRYGNLIKGEGRKLSTMVEQILDFAGANSGRKKYNLATTSVSDAVEDAISECGPLLADKGIEVEKDIAPLPDIKADRGALCQAVQNLIANSIKYSNGAPKIKVFARNGNGKIKIGVEDRGIGISKSDQRHIFEPFYRSRSVVDAQIHGNGLGLSLVKQIVEAHGGKVSVESEVGKGSRFTMEIPVA
jgi:signal transduction histidine kinase